MKSKQSLTIFFSLIAVLFLSGCANFLDGSQLKKEIEEKIEYENAKAYEIIIEAESGTGTVSPNENVIKKQTDFINLRFEPSNEYVFLEWQAKKNNELIKNAIVFDDSSLQNTTAHIIDISENLKIVPKCAKRPVVTGSSPIKTTITTATITVNFDQEININAFRFEASEVPEGATPLYDENNLIYAYEMSSFRYYKNLNFSTSDGKNCNSYYGIPVLDASGKKLLIPANRNKTPSSTMGTIFVTVGKEIFTTVTAKATMLKEYIFSFNYNDQSDTSAPEIRGFTVSNPQTNEPLIEYLNDNFDDVKDRKYITSNIKFSCETEDDFEIAGIKVTEELVYDSTGYLDGSKTSYFITDGYELINNLKKWSDYYLPLKASYDGIVRLSFEVIDSAGNSTKNNKSYLILKDENTEIENAFIYNITEESIKTILDSDGTPEEKINRINESLKEITVEIGEPITELSNDAFNLRPFICRNQNDYKEIYLLAGTDINNLKRYELQYEGTTKIDDTQITRLVYSTKIDSLSKTSDTIIKLVVVEPNGSIKTQTVGIPKTATMPTYYENNAKKVTQPANKDKYFDFRYTEITPDYEYNNFYAPSRITLYTKKYGTEEPELTYSPHSYSGINSDKIIQISLSTPKSNLTNYSSKVFHYSISSPLLSRYTFDYLPVSLYCFGTHYLGDYHSYYLSGYISSEEQFIFNNINYTENEYLFTTVSISSSDDTQNREKIYDIKINDDNYFVEIEEHYVYRSDKLTARHLYTKSEVVHINKSFFEDNQTNRISIKIYSKSLASYKVYANLIDVSSLNFKEPNLTVEAPIIINPDLKSITTDPDCDDILCRYPIDSIEYYYVKSKWPESLEDYTSKPENLMHDTPVTESKYITSMSNYTTYEGNLEYHLPSFQLEELNDGVYALIAKTTDYKGYETKENFVGAFSLTTLENIPEFTSGSLEIDASNIINTIQGIIPIITSYTDRIKMSCYVEQVDSSGNWTKCREFTKSAVSNKFTITKEDITPENTVMNPWVRLNIRFYSTMYTHEQYFFRCAPKYVKTYSNVDELNCKLKRFEPITDITYLLSSDKPCLVQLIESNENFGADYDSWKLKGDIVETNVFKAGSNWVYINDVDVSKKYCITQVLYADGTYFYTPVRTKVTDN